MWCDKHDIEYEGICPECFDEGISDEEIDDYFDNIGFGNRTEDTE